IGSKKSVIRNTSGNDGNNFSTTGKFRSKEDDSNEYHQRKDHRNDERNKTDIIVDEDLVSSQSRLYKIIRFFTRVNSHRDHREHDKREKNCREIFFDNIPVEDLHSKINRAKSSGNS